MQPTYIPISTLFGSQTRHTVPLFQRPYVWTQEDQWEPLWEDISGLLERIGRREGEQQVASHFLGTIVLEQASNPTGSLPRREVIDGQQRLTTLQLLLKAAEHSLSATESWAKSEKIGSEDDMRAVKVARGQVSRLTTNPDVSDDVESYKVWPTNEDRAQFQAVMDCEADAPIEPGSSRMASAYWFFRDVFQQFLAHADVGSRAKTFSAALRDYLKLIVLDLDVSDEPQAIFETLNAHGTPLLPADLMKNWLLWEAARQKADANGLYEAYWRPFDRDHEYWREKVGTGHAARARVDTFLQNWLTLATVEIVSAKHLYDRFLRYTRNLVKEAEGGHIDLNGLMGTVRRFADLYERIDKPKGNGRFDRFLARLQTLDMIVFHPLLLAIMDQSGDDETQLGEVAEVLESFLVRRMVCTYQTRGYGTLALRLLEAVTSRASGEPIADILRAELSGNEGSPDRWPNDVEFKEQWCTRRFYNGLRRDRVLMILQALEQHLHANSKLAEPIVDFDWAQLQIEHILPQSWVEHWPIPSGISADERDLRLHGIGNLTLVSGRLNPTMSNAPWLANETTPTSKKEALRQHSRLDINRQLLETAGDTWDEEKIAQRAEQLFDIAAKIWST